MSLAQPAPRASPGRQERWVKQVWQVLQVILAVLGLLALLGSAAYLASQVLLGLLGR